MKEDKEIVNKVANSGLVTIDLNDFVKDEQFIVIDIKDQLWEGLVLKEKSFRQFIQETDWTKFSHYNVVVFCSADAIIPTWAYMLLASALCPYAKTTVFGTLEDLRNKIVLDKINSLDPEIYMDARVVIKGCSDFNLSPDVYVQLVNQLQPKVKSLMFGEPCSTVPVYKRK